MNFFRLSDSSSEDDSLLNEAGTAEGTPEQSRSSRSSSRQTDHIPHSHSYQQISMHSDSSSTTSSTRETPPPLQPKSFRLQYESKEPDRIESNNSITNLADVMQNLNPCKYIHKVYVATICFAL